MVGSISWDGAYRIVPSRYPTIGIFDDVADPADLPIVIALAAATNPRILEEAGDLNLVRDEDRVAGPGTMPIMAAFTHAGPSRFGNGSYGIYYAALAEQTAVAETAYHRGRFLKDARLPDERLDMRVYQATIVGRYDDVRKVARANPIYDPDDYTAGNARGLRVYQANAADGIVFRSVRDRTGQCVAAFRPTRVSRCVVAHHLEYRFASYALASVMVVSSLA